MTDVNEDTTAPASRTEGLQPDTGEHTAPAATSAAPEPKSFAGAKRAPRAAAGPATDQSPTAAEEESLLRATLETVRVKAEELTAQTRDWASVRGGQARDLIDERPMAVVASAFALGLFVGMLAAR